MQRIPRSRTSAPLHMRKLVSQKVQCFILCSLFCSFAVTMHAQFRASIQGVVSDPTGAVIPNATVTLTDKATNQVLKNVTNGSGTYVFNALPPSNFAVTAEANGFKTKKLDNVHIIPEQANALNITLELGNASETVTVSGDTTPALETATASTSGTVGSNEIQHLPAFGRDVFQLAQLAPGVFGTGAQAGGGGSQSLPGTQIGGSASTDGIFKTENGPQIVANGGQNNANGITVDGISTVSAVWGGTSVITPSEDSVGDMKVVSNSYDAENGRFSGAQIQVTSKSGGNDVHGSLFFKMSRPGLNAYQRWNGSGSDIVGTPELRGLQKDFGDFNQYGGSVGGPIWKNKIFAFFNYETLRDNETARATGWYETPQFLTMAPAGSLASTILGYPGEGVAGTIVPQRCSTIGLTADQCAETSSGGLDVGSPLKSGLGKLDPTRVDTNTPGVGGGLDGVPDIAFVNSANPQNTTESQYNGRLDVNASSKDRVTFTIYWVPTDATSYNGPVRPANFYHKSVVNDAFSGIWNHVFSPTLLNEARANAAGWRWNDITNNPQMPFGLPQDNFDPMGTIGVNNNPGYQFFGAPGPQVFNQWTYSYQDIVTKVLGRHNLKFGGLLTRLYYLNENIGGTRPSYTFHNVWDFLNDAPYQENGIFNPQNGQTTPNRLDERENLWAAFVQDDFKLKPNLTVNLGLRWSYFEPMYSKEDNLSVVQFGSGADRLTGLNVRVGGNLYKPQHLNFGPQVGFAWSPMAQQNKMVFRGGFGINYNQNEIAIQANGAGNPPNVVTANFCCSTAAANDPDILYGLGSSPTSLFGYAPNPATISPYGSNNLPLTGGAIALTGFPSHIPTILTYHYSLDMQYDLGYNVVFTLGYQGTMGRHLITQNDQNAVAAAYGIPVNPRVNSIDYYQNTGSSAYNGMIATLKHQFSHSFLLDAQYTWSKSMDDGSQPYYINVYAANPHAAWGRSDYNVGNAFKIYGLWQPTIFRGDHGWMEKVFGGWSLSGIYNWHTGFPWTPELSVQNIYFSGSNNHGYGSLRPAAYLGGAGSDQSTNANKQGAPNRNFPKGALAYFTMPGYSEAPAFPAVGLVPQSSLVARNSFNSPGYSDLDGTLTKAFGLPKMPVLGENAKFEIRADAYNFFNKLNLQGGGGDSGGSINNVIVPNGDNSTFGQATKALGSRTIQIQGRFSF